MKYLVTTLLLLLATCGAASAATFQVTKTADENGACDPGDCALREAVLAANALPGPDIIEVPAGTYLLTIPGAQENNSFEGDLDILDEVEIRGSRSGKTVIQSAVADRVLSALGPGNISFEVYLKDVTITGGNSVLGAGIHAGNANLTLERAAVSGNATPSFGGGIEFQIGTLTLIDSIVSGNSAQAGGGGIEVFGLSNGPCHLILQNSTVSGNTTTIGGAVFNRGSSLTILDSTIANNTATNSASALFNDIGSQVSILIARSVLGGRCAWATGPTNYSGGGNLESPGDTCRLGDPTDQVSVGDLGLGPLADHGGPTLTHALLPGSPAIDAAGSDCDAFDQRGFSRPADGDLDGLAFCDAGAFEALARGVPADIPALGSLAQALLAGLLALAAINALRRL